MSLRGLGVAWKGGTDLLQNPGPSKIIASPRRVTMSRAIGMLMSLAGLSAIALQVIAKPCAVAVGCPMSAPEIDPSSAAGALTLLGGALLIVRSWRHREK